MSTAEVALRQGAEDPAPDGQQSGAGPSLRRDVGKGAAWAAASNITLRLANIAITAVLARIFAPEDFGTFAVALAVYLVVSSLGEAGLGSAIARSAGEPHDIAGTVTTIAVVLSSVLGVGMAVTAAPLADALGQPAAAEPMRVLSLSLVLTGVFAVPGALLVREFRQDRIFLGTMAGFVVSNPLLIVLALNGGDATSFAWSRVVGQLVTGLVFIACLSRRYRPGWRPAEVGPLLRFGLPLSLANLVNWSLLNADYLIIGRMVDAADVGVYMIAFNVASWATAILGSVLNNVVLPAFGRLVDEPVRLRESLVSATTLVALVAFPIAAVTIALAPSLVHTLFGDTWAPAAEVLAVLALYGAIYAFSLLHVNVLIATGATRQLLVLQLVWLLVLVPATVVGVRQGGLVGAAWAHVLVVGVVVLPCYLWVVGRNVGGLPAALLPAVLRPAAAAALAGGAAWSVSWFLGTSVTSFVLGGVVAALVYLAVARRMLVEQVPELARILPGRQSRPRPPYRVGIVLEGLALGGCPLNALDLARTLRARGHEVRLFAIEEEPKVSVLPHAAAAGFDVTLLPRDAGLLTRSRQLRRLVREHDLQALHVFAPWLGRAAAVATAGARGRASVVLNWNMDNEFPTTRRTPLIVGTTAMHAEARQRIGDSAWLIEPPVDLAVDRPDPDAGHSFREAHGLDPDDLVVTVVGRVDRVMKLPGILRALAAVERLDVPRLRLVVVGDGDAMAEVEQEARRVNGSLGRPAIVLTGSLADPHPAYAASDVSLGMGGSALRVMAHEVPLVVLGDGVFSRVFEPDSRDHFVRNGYYGYADPDAEQDLLAEQLHRLLDPDLRRRLGEFARPFVAERYGLETATSTLEQVYAAALAQRGSGPVRLGEAGYLVGRDLLGRARRRELGRRSSRAQGRSA